MRGVIERQWKREEGEARKAQGQTVQGNKGRHKAANLSLNVLRSTVARRREEEHCV